MSIQDAAKSNSKLTDFDDLKETVISHISKVRMLPKRSQKDDEQNHNLNKFR